MRHLSLLHRIKSSSVVHPTSYPVVTRVEAFRVIKLTTRLHLVPWLIMRANRPQLAYTSSWPVAQGQVCPSSDALVDWYLEREPILYGWQAVSVKRYPFFSSSSSLLLPHFEACSRFWSIGLSFLSFLIRDSR
jgi:hypothetical protein